MAKTNRQAQIRYSASLPVIVKGESCVWCPALRYCPSDEHRYCIMSGETLENWKEKRGQSCPLEDIEEVRF